MEQLKAFLSISRANLLLASIGHAILGMLIAASSLYDIATAKALIFILLHYSIALLACNINSLCDYDVDKRYKQYLSQGVDVLGKGKIRILIIVETCLSLGLISYFAWTGYYITATMAVFGLLCAYAYSAGPLRLKARGILTVVPILFGFYMLPLFGGWFLFQNSLTLPFLIFVIGYALMNEGFTLVNTCEDYSEDKAEGIRTWAHIFGMKKTLKIAYVMTTMGLICSVVLLGYIMAPGTAPLNIYSLMSLVSLAVTTLLILKASSQVRDAGKGPDLEQSAKIYGKKLPIWFLMTRYPLIITAVIMLI